MTIEWQIVATLAAPVVALVVGALLNRAIESRPRLVTYLGHVSAHTLTQQDGTPYHVYTHSVVIRNSGRKPATNVRLLHPYLPSFTVFPDVAHQVEALPGGSREIVFPALVPNEQITVSYLYFPPVTWNQVNGLIKSDEGLAHVLRVLPTRQYPQWFNRLAAGLMLAGLVALAYAGWMAFRWLLGTGVC